MAYKDENIMSQADLKKNILTFLKNLSKEIEEDKIPLFDAHIEFEPEHEESPAFKIQGGFDFIESPFTGYVDMILGLRYFDKDVENYETVQRIFEGWDKGDFDDGGQTDPN